MSRVQTMVQLTEDLVALLDREAARRGVSRSALIRTALEEFLRNDQEAAISRRIVDGYVRIPPETPDEWGDLAETTDQASVDLLRRLDAEERRQGRAPW
ncbi:MAG: CopG family transcriptional regulator [Actinomycetes bacterium]|jgi:Ribbon-helix-helix protein, copG family